MSKTIILTIILQTLTIDLRIVQRVILNTKLQALEISEYRIGYFCRKDFLLIKNSSTCSYESIGGNPREKWRPKTTFTHAH